MSAKGGLCGLLLLSSLVCGPTPASADPLIDMKKNITALQTKLTWQRGQMLNRPSGKAAFLGLQMGICSVPGLKAGIAVGKVTEKNRTAPAVLLTSSLWGGIGAGLLPVIDHSLMVEGFYRSYHSDRAGVVPKTEAMNGAHFLCVGIRGRSKNDFSDSAREVSIGPTLGMMASASTMLDIHDTANKVIRGPSFASGEWKSVNRALALSDSLNTFLDSISRDDPNAGKRFAQAQKMYRQLEKTAGKVQYPY